MESFNKPDIDDAIGFSHFFSQPTNKAAQLAGRPGRSKDPNVSGTTTIYVSRVAQAVHARNYPSDSALQLASADLLAILEADCQRQALSSSVCGLLSHTCLEICWDDKPHNDPCEPCKRLLDSTAREPQAAPSLPLHEIQFILTADELQNWLEALRNDVACFICSLVRGERVGHPLLWSGCPVAGSFCLKCGHSRVDNVCESGAELCRHWFLPGVRDTCNFCFIPRKVCPFLEYLASEYYAS
jgi:hypothetical protein